jgi:hypothetical protein
MRSADAQRVVGELSGPGQLKSILSSHNFASPRENHEAINRVDKFGCCNKCPKAKCSFAIPLMACIAATKSEVEFTDAAAPDSHLSPPDKQD